MIHLSSIDRQYIEERQDEDSSDKSDSHSEVSRTLNMDGMSTRLSAIQPQGLVQEKEVQMQMIQLNLGKNPQKSEYAPSSNNQTRDQNENEPTLKGRILGELMQEKKKYDDNSYKNNNAQYEDKDSEKGKNTINLKSATPAKEPKDYNNSLTAKLNNLNLSNDDIEEMMQFLNGNTNDGEN